MEEKEEYRKLNPRRLSPPPEIIKRLVNQDKGVMPRNPIIKFFKIFFGEGF